MKKEIVFISPYPEMTRTANQLVQKEYGEIAVTTATLAKGAEEAKKLEENDTRIIISRGATGALVKDAVKIPVILVDLTCYDIIVSLYKAKRIGGKIALFIFSSHSYYHNLTEIRKILGLKKELLIYYYRSSEELYSQLYDAHEQFCDVAVAAGNCILEKAKMLGIKGVMIGSSEEALKNAFIRARELLALQKKEQEVKKQLNAILNHTHGGVVSINTSGTVTYYNNTAKSILQIPVEEVIGKQAETLKTFSGFRKIYENGEPSVGRIITLGNNTHIVSRLPLQLENGDSGLIINFQETSKIEKIEAQIRKNLHAKGFNASHNFSDIITRSDKLKRLADRANNFAKTDGTVLITGESGTGKELFAQSIHNNSKRCGEAFVAINCASLPANLLESELFGYNEGAFTGAKKGGKAGLFEIAHKGTLFLDEILELPLSLQALLLRVLQEKTVRRIGGEKLIPVDVRIIASANKNLSEAVESAHFRSDLYFRLNELALHIPPLRSRKKDLPMLVGHFLKKHQQFSEDPLTEKTDGKNPSQNTTEVILSEPNINRLKNYSWPGNVRELENFVKRYLLLASSDGESPELILDELLEESIASYYQPNRVADATPEQTHSVRGYPPSVEEGFIPVKIGPLREMEKNIIHEVYKNHKYKKEDLADLLGISRTTLWKKLKAAPREIQ